MNDAYDTKASLSLPRHKSFGRESIPKASGMDSRPKYLWRGNDWVKELGHKFPMKRITLKCSGAPPNKKGTPPPHTLLSANYHFILQSLAYESPCADSTTPRVLVKYLPFSNMASRK